MTILLNCCCLNIISVVEGLQENDYYVPFRPKDAGAANYEVVERKDQSNANDVKQNALHSIVDKKSSGKYTNSIFIFFCVQKMLLLTKYKNKSCYFFRNACYLMIANHQLPIKILIEGYVGVNRVIHDVIAYKHLLKC